jgi:hypothetical protein
MTHVQFLSEPSAQDGWFVILNGVKNPLGPHWHSRRNPTGFFVRLRMTWGSENGYSIFEATLARG